MGVERSAECNTQLNKCGDLPLFFFPILTMNIAADCWSDGIAEALTNATSSQTSSSGGKPSDAGALAVGWVATVVSLLALGLVQ